MDNSPVMNDMVNIHPVTAADHQRLSVIWESAVKATHDFLSAEDFAYYKARLFSYFTQVSLFAYRTPTGEQAGFIGVADSAVEMLFVHDAFRGQGIGQALLHFAIHRLYARRLDVNEQNSPVVGFYTRMGFKVTGRSPVDGDGKPYPLLHLEYEEEE